MNTVLLELALLPRRSREEVRAWLDGLAALAQGRAAVELAAAMIVAWLARVDPAELGYLTFAAFCREQVDWGAGWRRSLVRLVESPLDLVKRAAAEGLIPLRLAIDAPGRVSPEDQAAWLETAAFPEAPERRVLDTFAGDDALTIGKARRLARICLGRGASTREVDDHLIRVWRDKQLPEQILAEARRAPDPPDERPPLSWDWCRQWEKPASVADALAKLDALQAVLRGRTAVLARAWMIVHHEALWTEGWETEEECAREVLGLSLRQGQRLTRLGFTLDWYPAIDRAVRDGLPPRLADRLGAVVIPRTVDAWLEIAGRVGKLELDRAISDALEGPRVVEAYREAIASATSAVGPDVKVALPHPAPPSPARSVTGPAELLPAAKWWVENVELPVRTGFGRVKDRDDHRCGNPECGRRSLRVEAHHLVPRSEGGTDDLANGVALCRVCHLRGVHGGRVSARVIDVAGRSAVLWTWPDGRRVVAFRPRDIGNGGTPT